MASRKPSAFAIRAHSINLLMTSSLRCMNRLMADCAAQLILLDLPHDRCVGRTLVKILRGAVAAQAVFVGKWFVKLDGTLLTFKNITSLNDIASTFTATAFPFSFSEQDIKLSTSYQLTPSLAARFVAQITTNHNAGLMVLQQDTTSYGPVLDYQPWDWVEFQGSYQYANRSSPGYNNNRSSLVGEDAEMTELNALRRFDEASVHVNQFQLYGTVRPFHTSEDSYFNSLSVYAAMNYDDYSYPASEIGRQHWSLPIHCLRLSH